MPLCISCRGEYWLPSEDNEEAQKPPPQEPSPTPIEQLAAEAERQTPDEDKPAHPKKESNCHQQRKPYICVRCGEDNRRWHDWANDSGFAHFDRFFFRSLPWGWLALSSFALPVIAALVIDFTPVASERIGVPLAILLIFVNFALLYALKDSLWRYDLLARVGRGFRPPLALLGVIAFVIALISGLIIVFMLEARTAQAKITATPTPIKYVTVTVPPSTATPVIPATPEPKGDGGFVPPVEVTATATEAPPFPAATVLPETGYAAALSLPVATIPDTQTPPSPDPPRTEGLLRVIMTILFALTFVDVTLSAMFLSAHDYSQWLNREMPQPIFAQERRLLRVIRDWLEEEIRKTSGRDRATGQEKRVETTITKVERTPDAGVILSIDADIETKPEGGNKTLRQLQSWLISADRWGRVLKMNREGPPQYVAIEEKSTNGANGTEGPNSNALVPVPNGDSNGWIETYRSNNETCISISTMRRQRSG